MSLGWFLVSRERERRVLESNAGNRVMYLLLLPAVCVLGTESIVCGVYRYCGEQMQWSWIAYGLMEREQLELGELCLPLFRNNLSTAVLDYLLVLLTMMGGLEIEHKWSKRPGSGSLVRWV